MGRAQKITLATILIFHNLEKYKTVGLLIFLVIWYVLLSISLMGVFKKSGVESWKGLVPVLHSLIWCDLTGRPKWHVVMLFIPIVNLFYYAGMSIDMVRSFGKNDFLHSLLSVIATPLFFFYLGNKPEEKYLGKIREMEASYAAQIEEARTGNKQRQYEKLMRENPYKKSSIREWSEAIIFAVFAAAFIRMFLIEAYKIPTSSMEGSLLVGDFLFVSKAHYGIRTPMTIAMVPLLHNTLPLTGKESYLTKPSLPYFRLPAFEEIDRNESIVFNYPEGDSVYVTPFRNFSVYDLRRNPDLKKDRQLRPYFAESNLRVRPTDKRDHYIKRCIAIAGDTLEIKNRDVYINGEKQVQPSQVQFQYLVKFKTPLNMSKLEEMGITKEDQGSANNNNGAGPGHMLLILTDEQKEALLEMDPEISIIPNDLYEVRIPRSTDPNDIAKWGISTAHIRGMLDRVVLMTLTAKQVGQIQLADSSVVILPFNRSEQLFPHDPKNFGNWSTDNYGPIYIPKKGQTISLNAENLPLYKRVIQNYEKNTLQLNNGKILINGEETNTYTFKQNYYWAMGDNRHNSEDSRFWGFVPEDHMVGKPLFIWMSTKGGGFLDGIRWERIFTTANKM